MNEPHSPTKQMRGAAVGSTSLRLENHFTSLRPTLILRSGVFANLDDSDRELSTHISVSEDNLFSLENASLSDEMSQEVRSDPALVAFRSSPIVQNSTNSLYLGSLFDSSSEECDDGNALQFNSFSKETDDDKPDDNSGTSLYCEHFSDFSQNINNGNNEVAKPDHRKNTINSIIVNLFENPDQRLTNIKRISIVIYATYESYRTIISSFLIVFVPQNCGGYSCSILENVRPVNNYEIAAITLNALMAIYFCALFYLERERENAISLYLVSDNKSPTDKEYLMHTIDAMEPGPKRKITRLNNWYRFLTQNILFCFFVNVSVSCVVIYNNYLNNTTFTVFVTNALFMINRIYKALKITSSGEYNIYSAYRTEQMLYNRDRSTWLQHQTEEFEHRVGVGPRRFIIARE